MIKSSPTTSGLHLDISQIAPEEYLYHLQRIQKTLEILNEEKASLELQFNAIVDKCNRLHIKENDFVYLNCKASERRSIHVPSFAAAFPGAMKTLREREAARIGRSLEELMEKGVTAITVKDAEELVGKIPLQPVVVISRTEHYSIIEKNQNRE
jgi:hypothetical protein